ncbi:MAG TPA: ornithine carbamoyltransferase, partial [Gaiellales bacterium]|nr:ornithine carbamoyltransferase [Gaiellales bacterium]
STATSAPSDLLRIADLDARQLYVLLDLAAEMKAMPHGWETALHGDTVAMFFEKPSTRTRVSFAAACQHLGALPLGLRPDELQLGRGEPISDTARVLSGYSSAIVVRTFAQAVLDEMAAAAEKPVINALTDEHHPCQALADLLTIRERFGSLQGVRTAYLGAGNNVAHSLMEAGALAGMHIVVGTPPGYEPDAAITDRAAATALAHGGSVSVVNDPAEAASGAHAVYTDVWVSMGDDEAQRAKREEVLRSFQVDTDLMRTADREAVFLHCLPAHRGEEVTADVIDGPASVVFRQAENRLWTEEAVLYAYIRRAWGDR